MRPNLELARGIYARDVAWFLGSFVNNFAKIPGGVPRWGKSLDDGEAVEEPSERSPRAYFWRMRETDNGALLFAASLMMIMTC